MGRSELLGPNVWRWFDGLEVTLPTPVHEIALAMMRGDGYTTNDECCASRMGCRPDRRQPGLARFGGMGACRSTWGPQVCAILAGSGAAAETLSRPSQRPGRGGSSAHCHSGAPDRWRILRSVDPSGTGLGRTAVVNYLNALIATGEVEALGPTRSPKRRYRWIGTAPPSD